MIWLGISVVVVGPAGLGARLFSARFLPCLALTVSVVARAQIATADLFSPGRPASPPRRICCCAGLQRKQPIRSTTCLRRDKEQSRAPSRIGQAHGLPAASGAATSGYDPLNRKRQKPNIIRGSQAKAVDPSRQPAAPGHCIERAAAARSRRRIWPTSRRRRRRYGPRAWPAAAQAAQD
jgi:hypothetical protein